MKKSILKILCLACSFIIILTSCNMAIKNDENDFNIEQEEYIIRFRMTGPMLYKKYMFILTPDNRILAEYVDENHKIHKFQTVLNEAQISYMEEHINEVHSLTEEDIKGYSGYTDQWHVYIQFEDVEASFDYGISKSPSVNILLEQILGCCDSEKSLKTVENLENAPVNYRKTMSYFATLEEEEE